MFDFAWTEIALIGVVALIAIGPKDLPVAIKTVAGMIKKARRMASEFQGHVDEMVREANLHEVRDQISQLRNFDIKSEITKAVDSDGSLRATLADNPLASTPSYTPPPYEPTAEPTAIADQAVEGEVLVAERPVEPAEPVVEAAPAPAFIPPEAGGTYAPPAPPSPPPAFVPPGTYTA